MELPNEGLERLAWTLGHAAHATAGLVRDPTPEAEPARFAKGEDAEPDAVDAAVDDGLEALGWRHLAVRRPSRARARRRRAPG